MSTLTVNVASPDGRMQKSFTVPGTSTLKQLLQEACLKLKLTETLSSPVCEGYTLRHGRTILDLSTSIRLSGLQPGAKLDLIKATKSNSVVNVALQYIDSSMPGIKSIGRLSGVFQASTSLWSVIATLEANSSGQLVLLIEENGKLKVPFLVILGQEYFGLDNLVKTTLSSIGVTNGTCLIRMSHRPDEQRTLVQAIALIEGSLAHEQVETFASPSQVDKTPLPIIIGEAAPAYSPPVTSTSPLYSCQNSVEINRSIIFYGPPVIVNNCPLPTAPDLPDSYYELGEGELRLHLASVQAHTRALLDAPLLSRTKLLEKRQTELLAKYPSVQIRFRFPDQYQLEATFQSTESCSQLFTFLEQCCSRQDFKPPALNLSVGLPPKNIMRNNLMLWQADLVPSAIINVSFACTERKSTLDWLRQDILSKEIPLPKAIPSPRTMVSSPSPATQPSESLDNINDNNDNHPPPNTIHSSPSKSPPNQKNPPFKRPSWLRLGGGGGSASTTSKLPR